MANFARSIKSPSYLSPRLRPSMPSRTLSGSSDVSVASNNSARSEDFGDIAGSGQNTPTGGSHLRGGELSTESGDGILGWNQVRDENDATPVIQTRSRRSRPIAIELPKVKRLNSSGSVYTPPEPLSARGDLPGGYFPLHEDPNARIHRPHPFYHDKKFGQHPTSRLHADTVPMLVDRPVSQPILDINMSQSHTPVSSYLPSGYHEGPMPMGKYYPSNYEQRTTSQTNLRPPTSGTLGTSVKSDTQVPRIFGDSTQRSSHESEVRRRLQQYQRDMMAQASMAATGLLGGSSGADTKTSDGVSRHNLAIPELRLTASATNKPLAPRLAPLGSPTGPVTPMELEGLGGDYLAARR